jgi:hypothetical protein
MGVFVVLFSLVCQAWQSPPGVRLMDVGTFLSLPLAAPALLALLGVAIAGGMFVVPLYAFLTTFVEKSQAARTIAANNIVNSGAMVIGALVAVTLTALGLALLDQLLFVAAMCVVSAWLGRLLYLSEKTD